MNSSPLVSHGVLESLEARLAPAGLVTLTTSGGVLTITGDAENNGLRITHQPTTGEWRIADNLVGTTYKYNGVDMVAPFNIPEQNGIKADFKDGNDKFEFQPTAAPSGLVLSGGINVKLGAGDDYLELGFVSAYTMVVNGPVVVDGGIGNDTLSLWMTATFANNVKLLGGAGNDTIQLLSTAAYQHYQKGLTIDLGTGVNTLNVDLVKFAVTGPLNIIGAGEVGLAQNINLHSGENQWDGPVNIGIKAGNVTLNLGNSSSDVFHLGSTMKVTTGGGDDALNFQGQISVLGAVSLDLKAGGNNLAFLTNGSLYANSLSYKGGVGSDNINHLNGHVLNLAGALSLSQGSGVNAWSAAAGSGITAGSLTLKGLDGNDTTFLQGDIFSISGNISANLGAGNNVFAFASTTSAFVGGNLSYIGTTGGDTFGAVSGATRILGNVSANLGTDGNNVIFSGTELYIGGSFKVIGGSTGSHNVTVSGPLVNIVHGIDFKGGANATNALFLTMASGSLGSLKYNGGSLLDYLILGNTDGTSTTRLDVFGSLTANLGKGNSAVYVTDSTVHGKTQIVSKSNVGDSDLVVFNQSTFQAAVSLMGGAASGVYLFDDIALRSDFLLNAGAGSDVVNIETAAGSPALSRWYGKVTILTGTGADQVSVGSAVPPDANAGSVFYKGIKIDGGVDSDTDTLVSGGNTFYAGTSLDQTNFP